MSPSTSVSFTEIVTHGKPHPEEMLGEILLRRYGEKCFPGIKKARLVYVDAGTETYRDHDGHQLLKRGVVTLGVCGGPFDEHARGYEAAKKQSSVGLLFDYLNNQEAIPPDEWAAWLPIVKRADQNDTQGQSALLDVFRTVNNLYRLEAPNYQEIALTVAGVIFVSQFQVNLEMIRAGDEFNANVATTAVELGNGRTIKVAAIWSDNRYILQRCTTDFDGKPDVLIQKNSQGQIQVHTIGKNSHKLHLTDAVVLIRRKEAELRGLVVSKSIDRLRSDGKVDGAECWWYQKAAERLLNGSATAPHAEPTRLSLELVTELVIDGLKRTYLLADDSYRPTAV